MKGAMMKNKEILSNIKRINNLNENSHTDKLYSLLDLDNNVLFGGCHCKDYFQDIFSIYNINPLPENIDNYQYGLTLTNSDFDKFKVLENKIKVLVKDRAVNSSYRKNYTEEGILKINDFLNKYNEIFNFDLILEEYDLEDKLFIVSFSLSQTNYPARVSLIFYLIREMLEVENGKEIDIKNNIYFSQNISFNALLTLTKEGLNKLLNIDWKKFKEIKGLSEYRTGVMDDIHNYSGFMSLSKELNKF